MNKWEWLKIVASTVAGMFAAIIAEPLKQKIMIHVKRRRIQQALIRELLSFRGNMCWLEDELTALEQKYSDEHIRTLNLKNRLQDFLDQPREAFEHYYQMEKDALFTIEEWGTFMNTYRYLERNRERVIKDPDELRDAVISAINITDGELKRRGVPSIKENGYRKKRPATQ